MEFVWKDTHVDPSENLTKLSQFAGAYARTTIDKTMEVRLLLKEKEQRILLLEQQLEKEKTNQESEQYVAQHQREFKKMRLQLQASISEKDLYICQIQAMVDLFKDNPQTDEFIKEEIKLNSVLIQQEDMFFHKISHINPYYETSDKLTNQVSDMRFEYE